MIVVVYFCVGEMVRIKRGMFVVRVEKNVCFVRDRERHSGRALCGVAGVRRILH